MKNTSFTFYYRKKSNNKVRNKNRHASSKTFYGNMTKKGRNNHKSITMPRNPICNVDQAPSMKLTKSRLKIFPKKSKKNINNDAPPKYPENGFLKGSKQQYQEMLDTKKK